MLKTSLVPNTGKPAVENLRSSGWGVSETEKNLKRILGSSAAFSLNGFHVIINVVMLTACKLDVQCTCVDLDITLFRLPCLRDGCRCDLSHNDVARIPITNLIRRQLTIVPNV